MHLNEQVALAAKNRLMRVGQRVSTVAVLMGVPPNYLSDLLRGRRTWTLATISAFADSTGSCITFSLDKGDGDVA